MKQPLGSVAQIAYIVENIEEAINNWSEFLDAGPFFVINDLEIIDPKYRGEAMGDFDFRIALGFSGGVCVEFIEQSDNVPSVYNEILAKKGYCFHHWAYMTKNFDDDLKKYQGQGLDVCFSGAAGVGGRFVYLDTTDKLQCMLEIIEFTPPVEEFFAMIEGASENWDGKDLIRYL